MEHMVFGTHPAERVDSRNISPVETLYFHIDHERSKSKHRPGDGKFLCAPFQLKRDQHFQTFVAVNPKKYPENMALLKLFYI
jgi:hypothetical protein